jgi:hypothetical protein
VELRLAENCHVLGPSAEEPADSAAFLEWLILAPKDGEAPEHAVGIKAASCILDEECEWKFLDGKAWETQSLSLTNSYKDSSLLISIGVVGVRNELDECPDDIASHCVLGVLLKCTVEVLHPPLSSH